ncbi:MAG: FAD-binding protein [Candidatus Bathyarchaeota archaeon]|nr:FAD-binding protein [Candidatus Bathyarchaeota archaeon]
MDVKPSAHEKIMKTDVLVIGGAGAGLRAGIEAKLSGADTIIASKMPAGGMSCTLLIGGYLTCVTPENEDQLFKQIVYTGGYINNQRLVDVFVKDAIHTIPQLRDYGVIIEYKPSETSDMPAHYMTTKIDNKPKGYGLLQAMRRKAEDIGVKILDKVIITELIKSDNTITGAVGVDLKSGEFLTISTKSVVIASGGGAYVFGRSDNPPGTTGDGFSLAYHAGAELVDMEFVTLVVPENIIPEIFKVKGEPPDSIISHGHAHYFLGGIKINENCETNIKGLFACGEVAGGLLGAARLGGTAVADTIIFGRRAGFSAAQFAKNRKDQDIDMNQVQKTKSNFVKMTKENNVSATDTLAKIKPILWKYLGPVKSEYTLNKALELLDDMNGEVSNLGARNPEEILSAYEAKNMLVLGKILASASLIRKETRGNFWRTDYPNPDNNKWIKNIVLWEDKGKVVTRIDDVVMTRLHSPVEPPIGSGCFWYHPKIDIK